MTNTTPTTTTYSLNAGQFITRSMRILGVLPSGGVPTADELQQGIIALNLMLKGMQADGINLYRQTQLSIAVGANQGVPGNPVTVSPLILGLEEARWVVTPQPNLYERPMMVYSYIDYQTLPNKFNGNTSGPSVIMFDRQEHASNLYLYPPPTLGGTVNMTVARSVLDVTQASDTVDVPVEWQEAIMYNLADRLMDDQGVASADPATAERISTHAQGLYQKMLDYDRPSSLWMRPAGRKGSRPPYR
jgi:hypothetical protein